MVTMETMFISSLAKNVDSILGHADSLIARLHIYNCNCHNEP